MAFTKDEKRLLMNTQYWADGACDDLDLDTMTGDDASYFMEELLRDYYDYSLMNPTRRSVIRKLAQKMTRFEGWGQA